MIYDVATANFYNNNNNLIVIWNMTAFTLQLEWPIVPDCSICQKLGSSDVLTAVEYFIP